jgi:hypothetical protein
MSDRIEATEEFDRLCFDYGLELDEDVRAPLFYFIRRCATR